MQLKKQLEQNPEAKKSSASDRKPENPALKNSIFIRMTLGWATCSLLGISTDAAATDTPWEIDSALLLYSETNRVQVAEPVVSATKELNEDEFLRIRIVVDSLTGSSANGAIPTNTAQTFTSPSGNGTYTTNANNTPLDPTFLDTRAALNIEWENATSRTFKKIYAINISREFDYTSIGVSSTTAIDLNNRNTTLTGGLSLGIDLVSPVGGIPLGLSSAPITTATKKAKDGANSTKTVADLLLGVTQVIDRNTLMQFNYTLGINDGYLTDPYKILSVVDNTGTLLTNNNRYRYEKRPNGRRLQAIYWKMVHQFKDNVVNLSYRYFWDDWDITSHTIDLRYRLELGSHHYLQPHARYYLQSKADFYYYKLIDGSIPNYASADYRLADMSTTTLGLLYGIELDSKHDITIRAELVTQSAEGDDPFPDVQAGLIQLGYSIQF